MSLHFQSHPTHVDRLRQLLSVRRSQLGITYDDLAAMSRVSRRTIVAVETGTSPGSMETWFRLATALEIGFNDIFVAPAAPAGQTDPDPAPVSPVVQLRPHVIFEPSSDMTGAIRIDGTRP